MNMSRWAQRHAIPRRPPGLASTAANLRAADRSKRAPALLRPALNQIGGAARLNRFETVLQYPTLTAAAADLGLRQAVLTSQIARLEEVNRPGFRAHFFLREGWHDAEQVRREHQGQGGPVGP